MGVDGRLRRLVILEKGVRRSEYLATEKEAQKRKVQLTKRMESLQEYTVNSLITAYTEEKERLGTALPLTCKSHAASLRIMLAPNDYLLGRKLSKSEGQHLMM